MRVAIIDLGTNSVRFDVHQIGPGSRLRELHREKLMVRLGQGLFLDGKLDPDAIRRTLQAFASFHRTAQELHASRVVAFGTSALREATDGDRLLNLIRERTGIEVRVIPGEEEARLIAAGILAHEPGLKGRYALVDIGGGSTEISLCRGRKVLHAVSFPLGTARLQQLFLKASPPRPEDVEQLRRHIRGVLLPVIAGDEWPKAERFYGSSGSIRTVGQLLQKGAGKSAARPIALKELSKLVERMAQMSTTQLLGLPGMEAKRVDMILAGAILLEECLRALGARKGRTTGYSLRDGILETELRLQRAHQKSQLGFRLDDLLAKAKRLGTAPAEAHLRQVTSLAEQLFTRLQRVHRLKPGWKSYLAAAAILHDVGESISPTAHERHSYYIVRNADFPSMEKWESEFIAQLCLWHRSGRPAPKELPFGDHKERRQAFFKCLALLRVADALDRGHRAQLRIRRVRIERKRVTLVVSGKNMDLELLRIEQKRALFEQVFDRQLAAKRV